MEEMCVCECVYMCVNNCKKDNKLLFLSPPSAGSDYTAISDTLPGDSFQPQCVTAQTIQDLVIENNETFTLSGSVVGDFPVVVTNTAEIIIHDDDSEFCVKKLIYQVNF